MLLEGVAEATEAVAPRREPVGAGDGGDEPVPEGEQVPSRRARSLDVVDEGGIRVFEAGDAVEADDGDPPSAERPQRLQVRAGGGMDDACHLPLG